MLSQLSYIPVVDMAGLEPATPRLSGVCSNQLSYAPGLPGQFHRFYQIRSLDDLKAEERRVGFLFLNGSNPQPAGWREGDHLFRKEVIQPQVPLRLPCYDFTPIAGRTVGSCLPKVSALT